MGKIMEPLAIKFTVANVLVCNNFKVINISAMVPCDQTFQKVMEVKTASRICLD